jgi:hypothetical protein
MVEVEVEVDSETKKLGLTDIVWYQYDNAD